MKAWRASLLVVLSFGLGLLLGSQLFGARAPALAATPALVPDSRASAQEDLLRAPSGSGVPQALRTEASASEEGLAASEPASARREAPARLERPKPADGVIRGSIVTLEGAAVSGAEVELAPPGDASKAQTRRTSSDAEGRFEFSGLPPGSWGITARHAAYVLQRRTCYPARVAGGATVDFVACPGIGVHVRVVGSGAERARVACRRVGSAQVRWSSWSPAEPTIALLPGAWELCACVDPLEDWPSDRGWKLAPIASSEQTIQVGTGEPLDVTLELAPVRCLYGLLKLPEGFQSGESRPALRLIEPEHGTREDFLTEGDRITRGAHADEQGRYGLFRLPSERWTAGVALSWGDPPEAQTVEVPGLTRIDFQPQGLGEEGHVIVDAFSPGGERVTEGVSLSLVHRDEEDDPDEGIWRPTQCVLLPDGGLRLIALPMEPDDARRASRKAQLVLRASLAGFARIDLPLDGLEGQRVRLAFTISAELTVVLVGEGGARAMRKGEAVLKGQGLDLWEGYDESAGAFRFTGLRPSSYLLSVMTWSNDRGEWRQDRLHAGNVEVRAGSQRVEVSMPVRADLLVQCSGIKAEVEAYLHSIDEDCTQDLQGDGGGTALQSSVDELGRVRFANVPAGSYHLSIGSRVQLVRVPSPPIDFEGREPRRFRFRLKAGDSPLRAAGVRSGDTLLAIDGQELGEEAALQRLGELPSLSSGGLVLTVERAGRSLDIRLEAQQFHAEGSLKFQLQPDLE